MYRAKNAVDFFDMVGQTEWNRDLQRTLIHWIGLRDTDAVLDAGCGAGHFLLKLAQRARLVTGVDSSEAMIRRAELNAEDNRIQNVSFVQGTMSNLPFSDSAFDIVVCVNVLFMFNNPEQPLRELLRVCKPGSQLILVNPSSEMNPWSIHAFCESHQIVDFERESLLSLATAVARKGSLSDEVLSRNLEAAGGDVVESLQVLDGMIHVIRIERKV